MTTKKKRQTYLFPRKKFKIVRVLHRITLYAKFVVSVTAAICTHVRPVCPFSACAYTGTAVTACGVSMTFELQPQCNLLGFPRGPRLFLHCNPIAAQQRRNAKCLFFFLQIRRADVRLTGVWTRLA